MVKHTQTIRWQLADVLFECVGPFCGVVLKELKGSKLQKKKVSQDPLYRSTSKLLYLDIFPSTLY